MQQESISRLSRVKHLGANGKGNATWVAQRVTGLLLIIGITKALYAICLTLITPGYAAILTNTGRFSPDIITNIVAYLTICIGLYHGAMGAKIIIEDYVSCRIAKVTSLLLMQLLTTGTILLLTVVLRSTLV